ncbi:MAG: AAA family ATPase, partial [Bdellovibrionia bacterium]
IKRDIGITSDLYLSIRKRLQEAEIQRAGTLRDLVVLRRAMAPGIDSRVPLSRQIPFAIAIGIFLGGLLVLLWEGLRPSVKSRGEVERRGISVLGEIPNAKQILKGQPDVMILDNAPNSFEADIFRYLRIKLLNFIGEPRKPGQIIQVSSPRTGDGKSFVSINLALALSKGGVKTLLIDLDMRRPAIHRYCSHRGPVIRDTVLGPVYRHASNLEIIYSAVRVEHPPEFLESEKFQNLLASLKKEYEMIVIDSPPLLGVIDSEIIARFIDAFLVVIHFGRTSRDDLQQTLKTIRDGVDKPIFAILNFVNRDSSYYYDSRTRAAERGRQPPTIS